MPVAVSRRLDPVTLPRRVTVEYKGCNLRLCRQLTSTEPPRSGRTYEREPEPTFLTGRGIGFLARRRRRNGPAHPRPRLGGNDARADCGVARATEGGGGKPARLRFCRPTPGGPRPGLDRLEEGWV